MNRTLNHFLPYTIFLNHSTNHNSYRLGDDLEIVYQGTVDIDYPPVLSSSDRAFRFHRVLDKIYTSYTNHPSRSISFGDVIILGEIAFACTRNGWISITLPESYWYSTQKSKVS